MNLKNLSFNQEGDEDLEGNKNIAELGIGPYTPDLLSPSTTTL